MKTNGFLNPVEIRKLINANTDEYASHFVYDHHPTQPKSSIELMTW